MLYHQIQGTIRVKNCFELDGLLDAVAAFHGSHSLDKRDNGDGTLTLDVWCVGGRSDSEITDLEESLKALGALAVEPGFFDVKTDNTRTKLEVGPAKFASGDGVISAHLDVIESELHTMSRDELLKLQAVVQEILNRP